MIGRLFRPDFTYGSGDPRASRKIRHRAIDFTVKFTYVQPIPIHSSRGAFMRRLAGGERERHLRAKDYATFVPGPCSGSLVGH